MAFTRRIIGKTLDLLNLQRHNDNYAEIETDLTNHESRITGAQSDITTHKASEKAHPAEHVTYSGAVVGATNIKEGLDSIKDTLDNVIIEGGDGTQAAAAAVSVSGTTYTTLKQRVDTEYLETDEKFTVVSEQLAETADQITALDAAKAGKGEVNALATQKANQAALDTEVTNRTNALAIEKAERMSEIDVERNRITNLATLTPGSTTGDADLKDIRVGYDGSAYANAGSSVRLQTGKIAKEVNSQGNDLSDINGKVYATWQLGGVITNGTPTTGVLTDSRIHSTIIPMSVSKDINVSVASGAKYIVHLYGASGYLGSMANYSTTTTTRVASITHPSAIYAIIVAGYSDDRTMTPGDVDALSAMITVIRSDTSRIDRIEGRFGNYILQEILMVDGYNINLGAGIGSVVSLTPETVSTYRYAIITCEEGDIFTINGIGGSNPRLWGFADTNNKLLSVANASVSVSDNLVLTAPKNARKLIINDSKSGRKSYVGADLTKTTRADRNRIATLEDKKIQTDEYLYGKEISMINGYNIKLAVGVGNPVNLTPEAVPVYRYAIVNCSENDMFIINGTGGENPRLWGFVDSNNILLSVADAVKTEHDLLLVAPKDASKLIINDLKTGKISYNGANLSKTLGGIVNTMNESDFETSLEELQIGLDNVSEKISIVSAEIDSARGTISTMLSAKELSIGTGNPTLNTYTYGIARVPYWSMSGETTGQSVTAYVSSFGDGWDGVEVSLIIMNPSGTPLEADFDVFQARINPIEYGTDVDSFTFLTAPVVHKSSNQGVIDKVYLTQFSQLDTSKPFMLQVYRKNDHEKDTNLNAVGIVAVEISPIKLQIIEVQQADQYNAWPFISDINNKLVTVYSKGLGHEDNTSPDIYRKTSIDGGKNWSSEKMIVNTVGVRDTVTGKGKDSEGNMLIWVRKGAPSDTAIHELYKTIDGETFTSISTPVFSVKASHIGDIFSVPTVGLMAFYNSEITNSWGVIKSSDNGVTWTQQIIETSIAKLDCPTEISGAYIGDGKIIAIGRKNHYEAGQPYVQFQIESPDHGVNWFKANTNIGDISLSTPSVIFDSSSDILSVYYFERGAGKLKLRQAKSSDVWGNPLAWPDSRIIAFGSTNAQDTGNTNAVAFGGKHIAVYYSGDATNAAIYAAIVSP